MKTIALPSLGTRQPTRLDHSVMNYKKKKYKWSKSSVLSLTRASKWSYSGRIAREIADRQNFKKEKFVLSRTFSNQ